ncbi:PREDICTED: CDGSH iron-sulfur domain-containing protein 1-like [Pseudopodoces humilis]|nr:PREDICTED: CDGSH iron-sulfur domain-containing protein 1-like [Pseudopodoces humilis]
MGALPGLSVLLFMGALPGLPPEDPILLTSEIFSGELFMDPPGPPLICLLDSLGNPIDRPSLIFSSFILVEWIAAVSLAAGAAAVGYLAYKKFLSKDKCCKAMVNPHIQKDNPKVVHAFDMEDLGDKAVYCRCWRSKKFPLCDGSHTKHNEETGDNVGPLIIKRKEA